MLLGSVWIIAAIFQFLDANGLMECFNGIRNDVSASSAFDTQGAEPLANVNSSLLQSWTNHESAADQLGVSLPVSHMLPQGFSCDAAGRFFAVTDGLSTFVGKTAPNSKRALPKQSASRSNQAMSIDFE